MLRVGRTQADRGAAAASQGPTSYRLALYAFVGMIAMLIVVLLVSPVDMDWLVFLVSIMIGYGIAALLYRLGRTGRLRV